METCSSYQDQNKEGFNRSLFVISKTSLFRGCKQLTLILAILITLMLILSFFSGVALASGYNAPTTVNPDPPPGSIYGPDQNPHGGYADTSNKCKTCHAVHNAEGYPDPSPSYVLLRANAASNECDYCHGTGGHTEKIVTTNFEGHTMGYEGYALDDTSPPFFTNSFSCSSCHSPHDTNTVRLSGETATHLLKKKPNPGKVEVADDTPQSEWCARCHGANYGIHTLKKDYYDPESGGILDRYGHDSDGFEPHGGSTRKCVYCHGQAYNIPMGDPQDTVNQGPTCKSCHTSSGYPHSQGASPNPPNDVTSRDMLKDTFGDNVGDEGETDPPSAANSQLDDVCNDCHNIGWLDGEGPPPPGADECADCHQGSGSHEVHVSDTVARGPQIDCTDCHTFGSGGGTGHGAGGVSFKDGKSLSQLDETTVCDDCHSPGGSFDGVNDSAIGAKANWASGVYQGTSLQSGKEEWCAGCHDQDPSIVNSQTAPNKVGNNSTYGYYVTGHGRNTNYARMSWQDSTASGNPGANKSCDNCHGNDKSHINTSSSNTRLKTGYENNQSNNNCNQCHPPGSGASGNPQFYTNSSGYESSAHAGKLCTDCHEVHGTLGSSSTFAAMTIANKESLCYQCHADGMVQNNAISGSSVADDIQDAFTLGNKHPLGATFNIGGPTFTLQCTTCHNIHIVTGKYWDADQNKSPVTRFANNTTLWGAASGQKMSDYAGSGTYRTPRGDIFSGSQLPDYATFCQDCHGPELYTPSNPGSNNHGGINWGGDAHGGMGAGVPAGGGSTPNWFTAGLAEGWDGDDHLNDTWPVISRGIGEQIWTRPAYNQADRITGANFVLSCTDCHEAHGSNGGSMIRPKFNDYAVPGAGNWNTTCNACHYYYSDWHAGMSCGNASCHQNNSRWPGSSYPHGIDRAGGGGARTLTGHPNLVANFKFDSSNLKDSGDWRLHGVWRVTAGSFVAGKQGHGNAIEVSDDPVEVGTENSYWSTDEGYHGTWKLTEMKYNTTLESWVYPTNDTIDEQKIMAKHTYTDGGYALTLKKIDGTYRAGLLVNVNGGGLYGVWDSDSNGLRGAFSKVSVPLNQWSHIAATFDTSGPDRDANDLSVGRVRIYVNGEDVTWSYPSNTQTYCQPGPGETYIFPYSQHSIVGDNVPGDPNYHNNPWGYEGHWCASALSIGGLNWSATSSNFVGRLDDVEVWNITKDAAYFDSADAESPPRISNVEGLIGSNELTVTFSEGVWTNTGQSGALTSSDFVFTDTDNGRTIQSVSHTAGSDTAVLTLSSALDDSNDVFVDTVGAVSNSVYDEYNNACTTDAVIVVMLSEVVTDAVFQLNEPAGSTYIMDEAGKVSGRINDPSQAITGDGYLHGDGVNNYIDFDYGTGSFDYTTSATIEVRIKPTGLAGTSDYIKRIFARDGSGSYQMSIWRNNTTFAPYFNAPSGTASIAFWAKPIDAHGGNTWKPVLTEYSTYPIVSDHWYKVRVVWNSSKVGGIPCDIFMDDQGTDGSGAGESWSGFANATDADQSLKPDVSKLYEGDMITSAVSGYTIGTNQGNHANNVFNGLIDWVDLKLDTDYSGIASIVSATASDASGQGAGIQTGDKVTIRFDRATQGTTINAGNINTALALNNGYSWLDGLLGIGSANWSTTTYINDILTITLSTTGGSPSVAVGDTITLDGTIKDVGLAPIIDSETITGSF